LLKPMTIVPAPLKTSPERRQPILFIL